jgi:chaperonin cofactor prefoldin
MSDIKHQHQKVQFERLLKTVDKVNREMGVVAKAAEIAHNVGSFRSQRLLARARDDLEDALLKIREAQRVLLEPSEPEEGENGHHSD